MLLHFRPGCGPIIKYYFFSWNWKTAYCNSSNTDSIISILKNLICISCLQSSCHTDFFVLICARRRMNWQFLSMQLKSCDSSNLHVFSIYKLQQNIGCDGCSYVFICKLLKLFPTIIKHATGRLVYIVTQELGHSGGRFHNWQYNHKCDIRACVYIHVSLSR